MLSSNNAELAKSLLRAIAAEVEIHAKLMAVTGSDFLLLHQVSITKMDGALWVWGGILSRLLHPYFHYDRNVMCSIIKV